MAAQIQEVFGDLLVTQPINKNETTMPSPQALRRKIILKHKKLPEGEDENSIIMRNDDSRQDLDLRNTVKNGVLYLEDPVDHEWCPHFFMLTEDKLLYTDVYQRAQEIEPDDEEEGFVRTPADVCIFENSIKI